MATMWHDQVEELKSDLDHAQKKVSKYKTWHKVATNHFTGVPGKEHKIGQALEKVSAWQETVDDLMLEIKQLEEVRTRCELAANSLYPTNNSLSTTHWARGTRRTAHVAQHRQNPRPQHGS